MQEISDNENLGEALTQAKTLLNRVYKMLRNNELNTTETKGLIPKKEEIQRIVKRSGLDRRSGKTNAEIAENITDKGDIEKGAVYYEG